MKIQRGQIYYADLDINEGSEQAGKRPVIIIQNNMGNEHSSTIIVAAITSNKTPALPTHIKLKVNGLPKYSVAMLEQVRTLSKKRLLDYICKVDAITLKKINFALSTSFGLHKNRENIFVVTLCRTCLQQFYNTNLYIIKSVDPDNDIKDTCMFCHTRKGFDYNLERRY